MTNPAPPAAPERVQLELDFLFAAGAVVALALGSIGPWATALGVVSVSGLDGDGWISLLCAIFAAGALYQCWRGIDRSKALILLGGIGGGVAAYHWHDISNQAPLIGVGWGVGLATLAGGALLLSGFNLQRRGGFTATAVKLPNAPENEALGGFLGGLEPIVPRDAWARLLRRLFVGPPARSAVRSAPADVPAADRADVGEGPVEPGPLEK
jgi:hypothetical protein